MSNRKNKEESKKVRASKRASVHHKKKAEKSCWWALPVSCLMLLILALIAFLGIHEFGEYRRFRVMRETVETAGFYTGIVIDNYDVSGVSLPSAIDHWKNNVESVYAGRKVTLRYGSQTWEISASELGYASNYEEVLSSAWSRGRNGTLEQRYRSINQIRTSVERYEISRRLFDENLLRSWTNSIAKELTLEPVNAEIVGFDINTHEFTLTSSANGYSVDAQNLCTQARDQLLQGGGTVEIEVKTLKPDVDSSDINGKFGMISQAVTNASSSTNNRLTNVKLACAAINGFCLKPGETFSYNDVVGIRSKAKGYKLATVYSSGEVAEDIGGGVCQVSTTLWNAAMKANCESVERHEHSIPVSYVDRGKDATVSWTSQDMKFKNNSSYPMYIICYVSENKRVYCEIYGEMFPDGKYITVEAKTTQTIQPGDPVYIYNPLLKSGTQQTVSKSRKGYRAEAYRVYWNADGTEIKRELLCKSYYKPAKEEIEYN